jgi:flagellar basal-body rod modification protein FlgD
MAVDTVKAAIDYSVPVKNRIPKKELDRDDFLNLMVKQLQNQNPMEPQSNEEFVNTMAQFNSLQSLTALDKNTQYNQAMDLIGKKITVKPLNKDPIEGIVASAGLDNGKVVVYIEGNSYPISEVVSVKAQDISSSSSYAGQDILQAAGMIGREVSIVADQQLIKGTVEKVGLENSLLKIYVAGQAYDISAITEVR